MNAVVGHHPMTATFVFPNRDDPDRPPMIRETWPIGAVPREGEEVWFSRGGDDADGWIVKCVCYTLTLGEVPHVEVRLVELAVTA